jgi:hypothetical protein
LPFAGLHRGQIPLALPWAWLAPLDWSVNNGACGNGSILV